MKRAAAILVAFTALGGSLALAQAVVPVHYGGDPDYDACPSSGEVRGLDPDGDNFLAVRAGPGGNYKMLAKLGPGAQVIICEERGRWLGIVWGRANCGTGSPIAKRQPYRGPCRSGWVSGKYVVTTAG